MIKIDKISEIIDNLENLSHEDLLSVSQTTMGLWLDTLSEEEIDEEYDLLMPKRDNEKDDEE
ncbi:MAG TPA: hypothetical protein VMX17_00395 [Candidatus Glassbacteria bacterium]|nr:hypothetical protein [Candidatus Glassbacteria bacterium]